MKDIIIIANQINSIVKNIEAYFIGISITQNNIITGLANDAISCIITSVVNGISTGIGAVG